VGRQFFDHHDMGMAEQCPGKTLNVEWLEGVDRDQ
jgi:hypothetical protein